MEWRQAVGVVAGCCWIYVVHVATKVKPNDIQVNGVSPKSTFLYECMQEHHHVQLFSSSHMENLAWPVE